MSDSYSIAIGGFVGASGPYGSLEQPIQQQIEILAETLFTEQVKLNSPLLFEETAKASFQAAEIFIKTKMARRPKEKSFEEQLAEIVIPYLKNNNTIGAIKEIRSKTQWGLKESKDWVDAFKLKHGL